jgi:predicted aspartyl protease
MSNIRSLSFRVEYNSIKDSLKTNVTVSAVFSSVPVKSRVITALWDTGATHSVIDNKIAEILGLTPVDLGIISGVNSVSLANITLLHIYLPNNILVENHRVTIADVKNGDMLIGMDIICRGDLMICNSGAKTSFSFVVPPFNDNPDWVEKSNALNTL